MPEEQLPPKSTRTYEEWKKALRKLISQKKGIPMKRVKVDDARVKSYYDRALMPEVCFKEMYNH
jgi:hypothetical protein